MTYPKYFIQTESWAQFWLDASLPKHSFYSLADGEKSIIAYKYPWHLGQSFLYVPKALHLTENLQNQLIKLGKKLRASYIKIDFDDQCDDLNRIYIQPKFKLSKKTLQFMQTMTLDTSKITLPEKLLNKHTPTPSKLKEFYTQNIPHFWQQTNQNIRRYTKKSCDQQWIISTEKSPENFASFWSIYSQTKDRQQFAIQPKSYLQKLFNQGFSRIIIIKDSENTPQCVWLGLSTENTLTYLAGGNTDYSFEYHGQYLAHLVATLICSQEKLPFYDLGGYNPDLGFGKFKEGYRGDIRTFQGPFDIVLRPIIYSCVSLIVDIIKRVKP